MAGDQGRQSAGAVESDLAPDPPAITNCTVHKDTRRVVERSLAEAFDTRGVLSKSTLPNAPKTFHRYQHGYAPFSERFLCFSVSSSCRNWLTFAMSFRSVS